MQEGLQIFKDDSMNERKEQQAINESLLWNMMGGSPHGQPTHSTNKFKREFYHKHVSSPKEEGKEEHTPKPPERYYHSLSSDNSLSPCRKKHRNDDNLQGEFRKIRAPTYEGEINTKEKHEDCLLGMSKYFRVHNYSSEKKALLDMYNLNGKVARWWRDLKHTKKDEVREIRWSNF